MAKDWLEGVESRYDVVCVGSGLGCLTAANTLGKLGYKVLVLEHHYQYGGLATWFKRPGRHIFDISLHGFPVGMKKSLRRYWTKPLAERVRKLSRIRFLNPQFEVESDFSRADFTRLLDEQFGIPRETTEAFYDHLRAMDYYDRDDRTARDVFEEFFPGRNDVHRLLMELISFANGSTWDDPAIAYGIVFSNFMSQGVFCYQGGTDQMIEEMQAELEKNGVTLRKNVLIDRIYTERDDGGSCVAGIHAVPRTGQERDIAARAVISGANIKNTIFELTGRDAFAPEFLQQAEAVRLNQSSCQVYMGVKRGESLENIGDIIFVSENPEFSSDELRDFKTTSRSYSMYYPDTRPQLAEDRYAIVASLNANWSDWADLDEAMYEKEKQRLCDEAVEALEPHLPGIRGKLDHVEAATPRTIKHYTRHFGGATFGTKFEGLQVSMDLPEHVHGLYHANSVGIIMSGWLGTINYGMIVAGKVDTFLQTEVPVASPLA